MTPLEEYRTLLHPDGYAKFLAARSHGHGKTWYSKSMTKDVVVYIMSWTNIEDGRIHLAKEMAADAALGHKWSDEKFQKETTLMTAEACKSWDGKMAKFAQIVNPSNGEEFLDICLELHELQSTQKDRPQVQVGLDRVRLFASAIMPADCRNQLLRVHYGSVEEKKQYHHPEAYGDTTIRGWLLLWSMWCFIDHVGCFIIGDFAEKAYDAKQCQSFNGSKDKFVEFQKKLYKQFLQKKSFELGKKIWNPPRQNKEMWRKRAKRCVVRFLHAQESIGASTWKVLPSPLTAWMSEKGTLSMYPADGVKPVGRAFSDWERQNCPWYIEFPDWNEFITPVENEAANLLKDGKTPDNLFPTLKLAELAESTTAAKELEAMLPTTDPEYDGKKARGNRMKDADDNSEFGSPGKL